MTTRLRPLGLLFAILSGLLLSACATDRPLETACPALGRFAYPQIGQTTNALPMADAVGPAAMRAAGGGTRIADAFARAYAPAPAMGDVPSRPQPALTPRAVWSDALILSGGGQWGAYGAGFIQGWTAHGRLPARIVTGISTGALQATFAYLGEDDRLVDAYSITDERMLVKRYGSAFFLRHASTADIAPLKTYVTTKIGPLIPRVAAEQQATGRRLFVGAVDGLSGTFHMIDLTQIATDPDLSAPQKQDCYIAALIASSAVPVVFRQVTINDRPWLDGGVRRAMFLPEMMQQIGEAHRMGGSGAGSVPTDGHVYAVKNGVTVVAPVDSLPAQLLPTIGRLRSIVFDQNEHDSLDLAAFHARQQGLTLYATSADGWDGGGVPACTGARPGREDMIFDPQFMACLIAYGQSRWKTGGDPWELQTIP